MSLQQFLQRILPWIQVGLSEGEHPVSVKFRGPKISAFLKVKLLVKFMFCVFQLRFSWQIQGAHPLSIGP